MKFYIKHIFIILLCGHYTFSKCQNYDAIWCFGDSAGLDFGSGNPQPIQSSVSTHEAAATYSDYLGNLQFYVGDDNQASFYSVVYNKNHQMMANGDSIILNGSTTNGVIIIPNPGDTNLYYLFYVNTTNGYLTYSVVDMSLQNGFGEVIQKNIVFGSELIVERLAGIKHANGRDWWIITHPYSNVYSLHLVTPFGILGPYNQAIGVDYQNYSTNIAFGEIAVSENGAKIAVATSVGLIELFNFDRCSGTISNWINIGPLSPIIPQDYFYGCEFSPNGNILYVTTLYPPYSKLIQIDLLQPSALNIVYSNNGDSVSFGQLQRGPDGKIYMANVFDWGFPNNTYDSLNTYIGVVENPDSLGIVCNFNPYSIYLGGKRSFYSLPNMPNYNLGELTGSGCDTLTNIFYGYENPMRFDLSPNPVLRTLNILISDPIASKYVFTLNIFNSKGQLVLNDPNYTTDYEVDLTTLSTGLYTVLLNHKGQISSKTFIKL